MKTSKIIIIQLILILELIVFSFQKSTLEAISIKNEKCQNELNKYSFQIHCILSGKISQSMFENFIIKTNSDYVPEITCEIPELSNSIGDYNKNVKISCYVNNFQKGKLAFRFEGESDELELINFKENILYLYIDCQKTINNLNKYGEESNELNIKFPSSVEKSTSDFGKGETKFIIKDIKNGCVNDIYNFNIIGKIVGDIEESGKYIPKDIKISLKNNLNAVCNIDIIDFDEFNLELFCYVVSNNKLNNENLEFDLSQIEKNEKNIIIKGLIDYLKTKTENKKIESNVNYGVRRLENDNDNKSLNSNIIDKSYVSTNIMSSVVSKKYNDNLTSTTFTSDIKSTLIGKTENMQTTISTTAPTPTNIKTTVKNTETMSTSLSTPVLTKLKTTIEEKTEIMSVTLSTTDHKNTPKTTIEENTQIMSTTLSTTDLVKKSNTLIASSTIYNNKKQSTIVDNSISIISTTVKNPGNLPSTIIEKDIIDTSLNFSYHNITSGFCSNGIYYFYIDGNMTNYNLIQSITDIKINLIEIKILNQIYNATCESEEKNSLNNKYKFKCSFIPPPYYFQKITIKKPTLVSNFELDYWPSDEITINIDEGIICTNNHFSLKDYDSLEACDEYSTNFSFVIKMESSLKNGKLQNKTISLEIDSSSPINTTICYLTDVNLDSNIILNCYIDNLDQDNRIENGINIRGIIKNNNNITDEYLITESNEYIKLINFKEIQFPNIECPLDFDIMHCKKVDKMEKICEECHKNYYLKDDNNNVCLTCSQLNEGCISCELSGNCTRCIEGYELKEDQGKCEIKQESECQNGGYGSDCKTCEQINPNCAECNKVGYCQKCQDGYYLSGIDNNSKCIKCLSTCEICDSLNKCKKCKKGFILNNGICASCLSLNEGCEECSEKFNKCNKCYNNALLKYELKENKCIQKLEEKKEEKPKTNLKFERFDGYEKEDDKVHFKPHFILLDNYLYNTKLVMTVMMTIKKMTSGNNLLRSLRGLEETYQKHIVVNCDQYGDALGNANDGGYLANFKCTTDLDEDEELLSVKPTKMEIKDKDDNPIQSFESEKTTINVDKMKVTALDEEYQEYNFDKLNILNITNVKLNDKLSFDILGDITPSKSKKEKKYELSLTDNNKKMLNTICHFPVINSETTQTISCTSSDNTQSLQFKIDSGIYGSTEDEKDKLILNTRDYLEIIAPKKSEKIATWIIVMIAIAGFVIICLIIFLIVKFKNKNNDLSQPSASGKLNTQKQKIKNIDDSKDVIVYKN